MVHFSSVDAPERLTQTPAGPCSAIVLPSGAAAMLGRCEESAPR
jgi:hypothetical protein